jgi:hypothetical protein
MQVSKEEPPLLPHKRGQNNKMDSEKGEYVVSMRKEITEEDIVNKTSGRLNAKYFNVKKGQYWSFRENSHLVRLILLYGATSFG